MNILKKILDEPLLTLTKISALIIFAALIISHILSFGWNEFGFGGIKEPEFISKYE